MTTKVENQPTGARLRAPLCIALALAGLLCPTIAAQVTPPGPGTIAVDIIYDSTTSGANSVPRFPETPSNEKGNEIVLCEGSRNVFRFYLSYYGDFVAEGDETCTLRFYAQDGETFHSAAPQFRKPGTLLYESDPIQIEPGNNAILFADINVEVPDRLTWTAEFDGLSGLAGDLASLIFYDVEWEDLKKENPLDEWQDVETGELINLEKVTVGATTGFYWENIDGQWKFIQTSSGPVNFVAGIHAHPEDSVRILRPPSDDEIILQGPAGKTVLLEYSHDQQNWRFWDKVDALPHCGRLTLPISEDFPRPRYFRVQGVEDTEIRMDVIAMNENGQMELAASGPNGVSFQVQATADFENWRIVGEYDFRTRPLRVVDERAAELDFQFYRIRLISSSD